MKFSYNYYKDLVLIGLEGRFGKDKIKKVSVPKNNGVVKEGVNILGKSTRIDPIVYFDDTKEIYDENDVFRFLERAIYAYNEGKNLEKLGLQEIVNWEKVKKLLRPCVVNYEANRERLKGLPYVCLLDLAVTFCVDVTEWLVSDDESVITVGVSHFLLERWDVDEKRLYQQAMENIEDAGYYMKTLKDFLEDHQMDESIVETSEEVPEVYVATVDDGIGGAATILSIQILKKFSEEMGSSKIYILPASVHEILLVDAEKAEASVLKTIVEEVNKKEVSEQDYLSDNIYCFSNGILKVA